MTTTTVTITVYCPDTDNNVPCSNLADGLRLLQEISGSSLYITDELGCSICIDLDCNNRPVLNGINNCD